MRRLLCPQCQTRLFFPDDRCLRCGTEVGYLLSQDQLVPAAEMARCTDHLVHGCNWLVNPGAGHDQGVYGLCRACALDINPAGNAGNVEVGIFKEEIRRVTRQLHRWDVDPGATFPPLRFDLRIPTNGEPVVIGHEHGLVTLDAGEADPVQLQSSRQRLGEPYRTPLGHVRHETGHWHWEAFVQPNPESLRAFRELFGDETVDYPQALKRHYQRPMDDSWAEFYLSRYAAAHPWEDYAESFAHILHMTDTMETATSEGLAAAPYGGFRQLYSQWTEVAVAINEIARSMGVADSYPFAPGPQAVAKLNFVYDLLVSKH